MLIFPLNVFPWVINGLIEAWVSLNRVNRFLMQEELDWHEFYSSNIDDSERSMIVIGNGLFTWDSSEKQNCVDSTGSKDVNCPDDLLKVDRSNNMEDDGATRFGHTQPLQNINLSVYKVQKSATVISSNCYRITTIKCVRSLVNN